MLHKTQDEGQARLEASPPPPQHSSSTQALILQRGVRTRRVHPTGVCMSGSVHGQNVASPQCPLFPPEQGGWRPTMLQTGMPDIHITPIEAASVVGMIPSPGSSRRCPPAKVSVEGEEHLSSPWALCASDIPGIQSAGGLQYVSTAHDCSVQFKLATNPCPLRLSSFITFLDIVSPTFSPTPRPKYFGPP